MLPQPLTLTLSRCPVSVGMLQMAAALTEGEFPQGRALCWTSPQCPTYSSSQPRKWNEGHFKPMWQMRKTEALVQCHSADVSQGQNSNPVWLTPVGDGYQVTLTWILVSGRGVALSWSKAL